jgi:hypothetical protein
MTKLEILSKVAPIASALIALIAAIFISRQIANIRRNREVDTLLKLIALADTERSIEAKHWLLYDLDKYSSAAQLRADKQALRHFSQLVHLFETMGVIVNNGYVPHKLIFDKYGLLIIGSWNRLHTLISGMRIETQGFEYAENFELMVSKYDAWAKRQPLKTVKGERMRRRESTRLLHLGGQTDGVHKGKAEDIRER